MAEAFKFRDAIIAEGKQLSSATYVELLKSLCRSEKFSEALSMLNEMIEKGVKPSYSQSVMLVCSLDAAGFSDEANQFLNVMRSNSWVPIDASVSSLTNKGQDVPSMEVAR